MSYDTDIGEKPTERKPPAGMTWEEIYTILRNDRRRLILSLLNDDPGKWDQGDVSSIIAAEETGKDPGECDTQERKRVYVSLYQNHLKMLDGVGAIDWNKDRGTFGPGENLDVFTDIHCDRPDDDDGVLSRAVGSIM